MLISKAINTSMKSSLTGSCLFFGFLYKRYIKVHKGTSGYKSSKAKAYKNTLCQGYFVLYMDMKFTEAAMPGIQLMDNDMIP